MPFIYKEPHHRIIGIQGKSGPDKSTLLKLLLRGYNTRVGELGDRLSGGERQWLGLARAFVHDGPLLLLDKPTSNLDSLNEAIILKSLKEQQQDKTIVLVSHRSSTMRIADHIFQMDHRRMS
ncbi:ATP-binding cassette domain-containing protein [Paenibacillus farraposensis]